MKSKTGHKYVYGEPWQMRHSRRLYTANMNRDAAQRRCHNNGITVEFKDDGELWVFRRNGFLARWRPYDADLFYGKGGRRPRKHVHDIHSVIDAVIAYFQRREAAV